MSGFASWLTGQGGCLHPKLKPFIEVDDNGDRGVVAEDDIEEGQQLMLIPLSCCLHMPTQQAWNTSQVQGLYSPAAAMSCRLFMPSNRSAVFYTAGRMQRCNQVSQGKARQHKPFPINSTAVTV